MTCNERSAYVFLSLVQARTGASLISRLGETPVTSVLAMPTAELAARLRMTGRATRIFEELRDKLDPQEVLGRLAQKGIEVLTPVDAGYPERLAHIPDPPPALFVDGVVPEGPSVALVGSRKASVTGIEVARELGRALGERGVSVVSGLALGVDAAAHEGVLAAGGRAVGVLGCGVDVIYPRANRELFGRVRQSGAIVSEYYLGEAPLAWRFPARNRVIAGLCDTLVVVEAAEKSGALITARHALEAGRDVWAVPGPALVAECRGSNRLLGDGAALLWDIAEFVDAVAPRDAPERGVHGLGSAAESVPDALPQNEALVLRGVGFEPTEVDVVAGRSGVRMRELLPALALLELKGYVTRTHNGAFLRRGVR